MKSFLSVAVVLSLVLGCGRDAPNNVPPPSKHKNIQLYVFAAMWCEACCRELPQFDTWPPIQGMSIKVFIEEGYKNGEKPTPESVAVFKKDHGIQNLNLVPDAWFYKTYKLYYSDGSFALPGAVFVDEYGNPLKIFQRGEKVDTIMAFAPQYIDGAVFP